MLGVKFAIEETIMFTYRPQKQQGQSQCPNDHGPKAKECRYGPWFCHVFPADISRLRGPPCYVAAAVGGQKKLNCLVSGGTVVKRYKADSAGEWVELVAVDQRFELLVQSVQFLAIERD